jgi:hypothetical protein
LLPIALAITPAVALFSGCADDSDRPAAQTAEQAVGVKPGSSTTKSVESRRDVIV